MTLWVGQFPTSCQPCWPGCRGKQCPQRGSQHHANKAGEPLENSSWRKRCLVGGQQSPRSCCICRRSCVGFQSLSSFEVKRTCRCFLSETAILLIRRYFRISLDLRLAEDDITNLRGKLIRQCQNDMIKPRPLARDATGRELRLDLREPN